MAALCADGRAALATAVLLLQGGQGITLTAADTCIIYDSGELNNSMAAPVAASAALLNS